MSPNQPRVCPSCGGPMSQWASFSCRECRDRGLRVDPFERAAAPEAPVVAPVVQDTAKYTYEIWSGGRRVLRVIGPDKSSAFNSMQKYMRWAVDKGHEPVLSGPPIDGVSMWRLCNGRLTSA